jgi:hypothetical protein
MLIGRDISIGSVEIGKLLVEFGDSREEVHGPLPFLVVRRAQTPISAIMRDSLQYTSHVTSILPNQVHECMDVGFAGEIQARSDMAHGRGNALGGPVISNTIFYL